MIRRYKIGEKLSDEFFTTWVFLSVEKRFLTTAQQRGIRERRLFFLKLTCLEVFEACYMSSICHGIWVVRQYDILVLTNDNYILLMTRPMPGPDKQFLSQMKQLKLTFLHVDGGFSIGSGYSKLSETFWNVWNLGKVHIFSGGHKNMTKSPNFFDATK